MPISHSLRIISSERNWEGTLTGSARSKQKSTQSRPKNADDTFVPDLLSESDNSATEKLQSTANTRGTQKSTRSKNARATDCRMDYLAILAIRCASRETLRRAALRWTMPRLAARISAGSASAMAATAAVRSPAEIASSTLRTVLRTRARRPLLTSVRRAIWRVAFLADFVLGIRCQTRRMVYKSGAYRRAGRLRQRRRPPQFPIYRPKSGFLQCFQRCSPASS